MLYVYYSHTRQFNGSTEDMITSDYQFKPVSAFVCLIADKSVQKWDILALMRHHFISVNALPTSLSDWLHINSKRLYILSDFNLQSNLNYQINLVEVDAPHI